MECIWKASIPPFQNVRLQTVLCRSSHFRVWFLWVSFKLLNRTKFVRRSLLHFPSLSYRASINLHVFMYLLCKVSAMWVITLPLQKNSQGYQLSRKLRLIILFLWVFIGSSKSNLSQVNGNSSIFTRKFWSSQFQNLVHMDKKKGDAEGH